MIGSTGLRRLNRIGCHTRHKYIGQAAIINMNVVIRHMTTGLQIRGALMSWGGHRGDWNLGGRGISATIGRFTFAGLIDAFPLTFPLFPCNTFPFPLRTFVWVLATPVSLRTPFVVRHLALDFFDWLACWLATGVATVQETRNLLLQRHYVLRTVCHTFQINGARGRESLWENPNPIPDPNSNKTQDKS